MAPRKSHPKGIDPANPNRNFVEMSYANKGDEEGFREYMYGDYKYPFTNTPSPKKASGYGHGVGQRAGCLRLSGMKGAHRIGKRSVTRGA